MYNDTTLCHLLKNGRIIDPATGTDEIADFLIADEQIAKIAPSISAEDAARLLEKLPAPPASALSVTDVSGCVIAPGLVDTHVHFRDPGFPEKEDVYSGAAAAAAGGYTSVVMMANTKPPLDDPAAVRDLLARGAQTPIHVYTCANVTKKMAGREMTDFAALKAAGAVGLTDDGLPILSEEVLRQALAKAKALDLPVSLHEEDPQYIGLAGVNADGEAAKALGIAGASREAEISMAKRDVALAIEQDATLVIQHISCAETVALLREARKKNPRIHGEATPHHFSLTDRAVLEKGSLAKVNPPIRTEKDRLAIVEGLLDGTLDLIATDHAPHTAEEKARPLEKAPSGMIGLETALSLALKHLVQEEGMSLAQLLRCMSLNPAALYGLPAGRLCEGGPADLVVFDPAATRTVPGVFHSRSTNSPFIGETLPGVIRLTIAGGRIVFQNAL